MYDLTAANTSVSLRFLQRADQARAFALAVLKFVRSKAKQKEGLKPQLKSIQRKRVTTARALFAAHRRHILRPGNPQSKVTRG
jgi:ABC-type polar amino acid transport system ATPase subunit